MQLKITPWTDSTPPTEKALREFLAREGLDFYA